MSFDSNVVGWTGDPVLGETKEGHNRRQMGRLRFHVRREDTEFRSNCLRRGNACVLVLYGMQVASLVW